MKKIIQKYLKKKDGFTLVELIVVLAVLGIIAGIAVPRFTDVQKNSKWKADIATAAIIANAAELYYMNERPSDPGDISIDDLDGYLEDDDSIAPQYKVDGDTVDFKLDLSSTGKATIYYTDSTDDLEIYPDTPSSRPDDLN